MSTQDPDDAKFKDPYSDWSNEFMNKHQDVVYKTMTPPKPKEDLSTKAWRTIGCFINFTFIKFPTFVGRGLMYLFENISRVINIKIGFFNAEKVEMAGIIQKQKDDIAELKELNKALDEDNWAYNDSIEDLHRVGQQMHDEVVAVYGKNHWLALRWREAESRAQAILNINYESANKYLDIRERRELQSKRPILYPFLNVMSRKDEESKTTKKAAKKAAHKKKRRS